jgi:hypothetical protein
MANHYQIKELNKTMGYINVKYWTDDFTDGFVFKIDLPIDENNNIPTGQDLTDLIISRFPTGQIEWHLNRLDLASKVDYSSIESLIS